MIKVISFKENIKEMRELFKPHWEEIATNKQSRNLNVNEDLFFLLEETKKLLTIGAFIDNKLIGYSVNIITPDTHDKTKIFCNNDALYVSKEYRKGNIGIKLIKKTETIASTMGLYGVLWHAKPNSSLDKLLEKLNYSIKDFLYMKEV